MNNPNEYWALYRQAKEGVVNIPVGMSAATRQDYLKMLETELRPLLTLRDALMGQETKRNDPAETLIHAMAEYGLENSWNDSDIIDALIDVGVTKEDFQNAGYAHFVKDYFKDEKTEKPSIDSQIQAASTRAAEIPSSGNAPAHETSLRR